MACIATGLSLLYGLIPYVDETVVPEINDFIRVAFGAFCRLTWAIVVGWIIFACVKGYGGMLILMDFIHVKNIDDLNIPG